MKSLKSTVKSLATGAVIGAGLLIAASAFADGHRGGDRNDRGHEQHERNFDRDHDRGRDWDRHDFYRDHHDFDRGRTGVRIELPLPPHPRFFLPFLPPPPIPVFIAYAQVIDVDPIVTRIPDYHHERDWDGYGRDEQRTDGYRVTYLFRGREYNTVMSYDPGERVRVRVGNGIEVLQ